MYNHMSFETSSSVELTLNRVQHQIKQAQSAHRQELDKRDEKILQLEKKLVGLQSKHRDLNLEFDEYKRQVNDKENSHYMEMLSTNQFLEQELALERTRNEELRMELSRVRQELSLQEDKVVHLESEHEKANHIIRTLVKKVQLQQQQQRSPPSHQPTSTTSTMGSTMGQRRNRIVTS